MLARLLQVRTTVVDVHAHAGILVGPVGVVVSPQLGQHGVDLDRVDVPGALRERGGHVVPGAGADDENVVEVARPQVAVGEEVEGQDLAQRVDGVHGLVRDVVGRHDQHTVGVLGLERGDLVVGRPVVERRGGLNRQQGDHRQHRRSLQPAKVAAQRDDHPDADDQAPHHGRKTQERQQGEDRDPADAADDVEAVGLDATVPGPADLDGLPLSAPVRHPDHVLGARLHPAQGPAGVLGGPGDQQRVPVNGDLGAEPAAHVRRDHPDGVGREPERASHDEPGDLRVLRAHPDGQLAVGPAGRDGTPLHRHRRDTLVGDGPFDHHLAVAERRRVGGCACGQGYVGPGIGEQQ